MIYDDKGYVIRCVELMDTGRVYYRGMNNAYANEKDAIPQSHTYTLSGVKRAIANLRKMYPAEEYSIERLSVYYPEILFLQSKSTKRKNLSDSIDNALMRLDELWNGNNFDNGDKMRINEVRRTLMNAKERLIGSGKG